MLACHASSSSSSKFTHEKREKARGGVNSDIKAPPLNKYMENDQNKIISQANRKLLEIPNHKKYEKTT